MYVLAYKIYNLHIADGLVLNVCILDELVMYATMQTKFMCNR